MDCNAKIEILALVFHDTFVVPHSAMALVAYHFGKATPDHKMWAECSHMPEWKSDSQGKFLRDAIEASKKSQITKHKIYFEYSPKALKRQGRVKI